MGKYIKVIISGVVGGTLLGLFIALFVVGPSAGGAGAAFLLFGLFAGLLYSITASIIIFSLDKNRKIKQLIPLGLIASIFFIYLLANKYSELTCEISEADSYASVVRYSKENIYNVKYLSSEGVRLAGCKYGFEYKSNVHFRLLIVDVNGEVTLND